MTLRARCEYTARIGSRLLDRGRPWHETDQDRRRRDRRAGDRGGDCRRLWDSRARLDRVLYARCSRQERVEARDCRRCTVLDLAHRGRHHRADAVARRRRRRRSADDRTRACRPFADRPSDRSHPYQRPRADTAGDANRSDARPRPARDRTARSRRRSRRFGRRFGQWRAGAADRPAGRLGRSDRRCHRRERNARRKRRRRDGRGADRTRCGSLRCRRPGAGRTCTSMPVSARPPSGSWPASIGPAG